MTTTDDTDRQLCWLHDEVEFSLWHWMSGLGIVLLVEYVDSPAPQHPAWALWMIAAGTALGFYTARSLMRGMSTAFLLWGDWRDAVAEQRRQVPYLGSRSTCGREWATLSTNRTRVIMRAGWNVVCPLAVEGSMLLLATIMAFSGGTLLAGMWW